MGEKPQKSPWVSRLLDPKILGPVIAALVGGGAGWGGKIFADAGGADTVKLIADSVTRAELAPVLRHIEHQDTALMRIFFRQDVQMTEAQKTRADSLMKAALHNINYGGNP